MSGLNPTPRELLVDASGRPYFLWDMDMTLERFERELAAADRPTRAWLVGNLMRQAKPDDVFTFVSPDEIGELWSDLARHLGRTRPFWEWVMTTWKVPLR